MKASHSQIGGLLDKPNPATRFYLFHGPDEAGAGELAARLGRALGAGAERVDLEPKTVRAAPGSLADEAASLSLFGDRRWLRLTGVDDGLTEAVTLLLKAPRCENPVVAIAPGLKASARLVKLAIAEAQALAYGCYVPEGPEAARLAVSLAREQGVRLVGEVAQRLATAAGGDRAVLAREIEKIALYLDATPETPRTADEPVLAAIGAELGEAELGDGIAAIVEGRAAEVGTELARLASAGSSGVVLLRLLVRRLLLLAELRAEIDAGTPLDMALERQRVFFREKAAMTQALRRWNAAQLARAIDRARIAERAMMHGASAGEILAEVECLAIARAAARN